MPSKPTSSEGTVAKGSTGYGSQGLGANLVRVTPHPAFIGLERLDYLVVCGQIVLACVLVLGAVAASNVAARKAQSEVHPRITGGEALFTALRFSRGRLSGVDEVLTELPIHVRNRFL
jgi:hypothetical protein